MKLHELEELLYHHNIACAVKTQFGDKEPLIALVRFSNGSWPGKEYSAESRTYVFRSDNKKYVPGMLGASVFADSLDGSDTGVRLDRYLPSWIVEDAELMTLEEFRKAYPNVRI